MAIQIENEALLFIQYGDAANLELRAIYQYTQDGKRAIQAAKHSDYMRDTEATVRLVLIDTCCGEALTRLLHPGDL